MNLSTTQTLSCIYKSDLSVGQSAHFRCQYRIGQPGQTRVTPQTLQICRRISCQSTLSGQPTSFSPNDEILRFFDAFNNRDLGSLLSLLDESIIHHNMAWTQPLQGRKLVSDFYVDLLRSIDKNVRFFVEQTTGEGSLNVAVMWHIRVNQIELPLSKGVSFYTFSPQGKLVFIREAPEHLAKTPMLAIPALNLATPVIRAASPLLNMMQQVSPFQLPQALSHPNPPPVRVLQAPPVRAAEGPGQKAPKGPSEDPPENGVVMRKLGEADVDGGELGSVRNNLEQLYQEEELSPRSADVVRANTNKGLVYNTVADVPPLSKAHMNGNGVANGLPAQLKITTATLEAPAAPQAPRQPQQQQQVQKPKGDLSVLNGIWTKDLSRCEISKYNQALDLLQVSGVQKYTANTLNSVEIVCNESTGQFEVRFITPIPYFKVTEAYAVGRTVEMGRRDLVAGVQKAFTKRVDYGFDIDITWGQPNGGGAFENFRLERGELVVTSSLTVGDRSVTTRQVYVKDR